MMILADLRMLGLQVIDKEFISLRPWRCFADDLRFADAKNVLV